MVTGCEKKLTEKIISSYPSGSPSKIEYYRWQGDFEVLVKHIRFYESGEKMEEGSFLNDERDGEWTYWYDNGKVWSKGYYKNGLREGETNVYFKSGIMQYSGFYNEGETDGKWTFYGGQGEKIKEVYYEKGEKIKEEEFE